MENLQNEKIISISDENIAQVNILIEHDELEPYEKQYIKEKQKHVILRGFRKGKAPEEMVAIYFKEEAKQTAKNNLIYNKYMKLLQDHKLQPLSEPKIENIKEESGGNISAKIVVEVLQPVVLGQYLGLEILPATQKIVQDGVNSTINEIKQTYPKLIDAANGVAQNNNVVVIDFTMTDNNGKELEKQVDFKVSLGVNLYFKDFEANILGMKPGETKEFDLLFPESYQKDELKNKNVHFVLTVKFIHEVSEYTDEELAKVLGYETQEKMNELLTKEIEMKYKDEERLHYENQILGQLLAAHNLNIPNKLLDGEIKRILVEKPDMDLEKVKDIAMRFVKTDLILHAIYERHPDIQFKQEEFNTKVAELAVKANDTVENTIKKLQQTGKLQPFINYLTNCKVIDFLIEVSDKKAHKGERNE